MSSSLYYLTGSYGSTGTDYQVDTVVLNGVTVSGSPTVLESGQPNGNEYFNGLAINAASNNYFVSVFNGSTAGLIYRETIGVTPTFSSGNLVATVAGDDISTMGVDSTNNILYYSDGKSLYADRFGSSFNNTPSSPAVNLGTTPETNGVPDYLRSIVFDHAENAVYAAAAAASTYYGFPSVTGGPPVTTESLYSNYIFKISVSPTMASGSATFASALAGGAQVPFADGQVEAVALDTATDTLYFATDPYITVAADDVAGVYALTLSGANAGDISTVWSEKFTGTPSSDLAHIDGIVIDPVTGDYYLTTSYSDEIYSGNINSSATPTAMLHSATSGQDSSTYVLAAAVLDPPAPPTITLSGTSNEALQGGAAISALSSAPTLTDPNSTLSSATIMLSGYVSGDTLGINGTTSGTFDSGKVSYSASNGTLVLTGSDSLAAYATLLDEVTFQDSGNESATNAHPTHVLSWVVNDGTTTSTTATSTITIDRAPSIAAGGATNSLVAGAAISGGAALTGDSDPDGDTLTITALSGGSLGTGLSGTYGVLTLSSNGSYNYSASNTAAIAAAPDGSAPVDHFTFTVSDGKGGIATETLAITIDRDPTSSPVSASLVAGGTVTGAALTGITDPDGDALSVSAISGGAVGSGVSGTYGVLTLNANGSYSYAASNSTALAGAATGSKPVDHFTFTASDGRGGTTLETLSITIDRAPIIAAGGATTTLLAGGSTTGQALAGDSDPDGNSLTITALSTGSLGTAVAGTYGQLTLNADGSYSYAANNSAALAAAATGSAPVDQFIYTVSDGQGATVLETLSVTIDRAPIVTSLSLSTAEGGVLSGSAGAALAGDTDPDGQTLSIGTVTGSGGSAAAGDAVTGAYGTLTLNADGSYSYSADNTAAIDAAENGSAPVDQFTFSVTDGAGTSTLETLDITVNRPLAISTGAPVTYTPGGPLITPDVTAAITDPDGAQITSAVLYLSGGSLPGDVLSFVNQNGITGSFSNGTLTLTGVASTDTYQDAIASVQFSSTDADPYANGANPTRTLGIILTDAAGQSQPASQLIDISPDIDITTGENLSLTSISSGREIDFFSTGATLNLTNPADFAGTIDGFGGNTIDLVSLAVASESFSSGTLTLYDRLGNVVDTLTLSEPAGITSADFHLASGSFSGTDLTLCFYPGTRIATPEGEVAVEDLRAGQLVLTSTGAAPLHWIGRTEIATRFANKLRTLPIRVTAGALGNGLPARDLLLSPDHALFMDGVLVQAAALINHISIRREYDVPEHFTYYHLELDRHVLLLAEGALAESFVDNVDRMQFHNWDARIAPATPIAELPYPRAKSARQLPQRLRRVTAA